MLDMMNQDVFMNPFEAFFEIQVPFIPGHVEKGEKGKYFSYPNFLHIQTTMPIKVEL